MINSPNKINQLEDAKLKLELSKTSLLVHHHKYPFHIHVCRSLLV